MKMLKGERTVSLILFDINIMLHFNLRSPFVHFNFEMINLFVSNENYLRTERKVQESFLDP